MNQFVKHLLIALLALCAAGAAIAQTQTTVPQTAPPAIATPPQYENQPFAELLKIEDFNTAYRAALAQSPLAKQSWALRDAGWPLSKFVPGPNNRRVLVTGTCSDQKCNLNKVHVFYDPAVRKAYVHLTLGNRAAWLGRPSTFEKRVLEPLLK
jgi:hypothetical protein